MLKNPELRYKLSTPKKISNILSLDFCKMLQQIFFLCVCVKMIVLDTYEHVKQICLKVILCGAYLFASLCHITLRTTPTEAVAFRL